MIKKKIGLFGGSFNPIHERHKGIITDSLKFVDEVWIIPCKKHAFNKELVNPKYRVKMIKLALNDPDDKIRKRIKISNIEIKTKGKSYTIDTVRKLKKKHKTYDFYLILGRDIIKDIKKWKSYKELINEVKFIIFERKGISSTVIRNEIKQGKTIKKFVSKKVNDYLIKNKLYR